jgi:hypothetical protein
VQAKAAEEGIAELEKRRLQQSLDRLTGKLFPGGNNASKIRRIDQEPAAFRGGPPTGPIVMGNAWTYNAKFRPFDYGISYPTYVASGDGSQWVSLYNYTREERWPNYFPPSLYDQASDPDEFSEVFYAFVSANIPAPSWATEPLKKFKSPVYGYVYYYVKYSGDPSSVRAWFASSNALDIKSEAFRFLDFTEVLPAGGANGYAVNHSASSSWQQWDYSVYIGEIEGNPITADNPIYRDSLFVISQGREIFDIEKTEVVYVTPTTATEISTPGWVENQYIPEVHGKLVRSEFGDPEFLPTRFAVDWYRAFSAIDEASENDDSLMSGISFSSYELFWAVANWDNPEPFRERYLFTQGRPQIELVFPEREDRPWADPDDLPLFQGRIEGANPRTENYIGNVNTPMVYYYMTDDFRGDINIGTGTVEAEIAYGIPGYNLLSSTVNYGLEGEPVQNAWALPYTLPYSSDPAFSYEDQQAFKEIVSTSFFEFQAAVREPRKPRIARMPLNPEATLPFLNEPIYGNYQDLKVHFFFDYEKPQIIRSKIGPPPVPPPAPPTP